MIRCDRYILDERTPIWQDAHGSYHIYERPAVSRLEDMCAPLSPQRDMSLIRLVWFNVCARWREAHQPSPLCVDLTRINKEHRQ